MQQETLTHQMKSVVRQMPFAYVKRQSASRRYFFKKNYFKVNNLFVPAVGDRDSDDLRQNSSALFPSESYIDFLQQADIQKKIGAEVQYAECPDAPFELFVKTGDVRFLPATFMDTIRREFNKIQDARTWLPQLGALANSRLKMLIWVREHKITACIRNKF